MTETSIAAINARAIELRAKGRLREAIATFAEGIVRFPSAALLYNNLAMVLDEMGAVKEALEAYDSALTRAPHLVAAMTGKASLLLRDGRVDEARRLFDDALGVDPQWLPAHLGLYELLQIKGDLAGAVAHLRRALERQRLFSHVAPAEQRSILVLCAPGDWQANVPVDFLFDRKTTSVHKLFLLDQARLAGQSLPAYDVVFNAIAESDEAMPLLRLARNFIDRQTRPSINAPERVAEIGRRQLADTLAATGCVVAPVARVDRAALVRGELPFGYPSIVRPVGSHAGHDLARVDSERELEQYAARVGAESFFVGPFVEYASDDGFYRKYRIVFVDGRPYPVHLAISPNWMIHYYNAPMSEHEWMRNEEAEFLRNFESIFGGDLRAVLDAVARAAGLEYFGIDCTLDRDGRLLIFEADTAMLVHTTDPVELYPYKHEFVPRIFRAIEAMVDARKAADT
ncbi:MAG TPA: tetratricopeptide repeat protein [Candidatus Acidoferrales bacterium]|nr:tetratricopeptide repeat protein [Candidatus Acidoferrales bacterium]